MESIMWTIKAVLFSGIEAFVVATVGVVLIAGLYQLIRDRVGSILHKVRKSRALAPVAARKDD